LTLHVRAIAAALSLADAVADRIERQDSARIGRYLRLVDRQRGVLSSWLLRQVAVEVEGSNLHVIRRCAKCGNYDHGAPTALTREGRVAPVYLSSAHAGGLVVAAAARVPIGVDLEPLWNAPGPEAECQFLTRDESARLAALPSDERALARLKIWVIKEAVLKSTGLGLDLDPLSLQVSGSVSGRVSVSQPARDPYWFSHVVLLDLPVPSDHLSVLAVLGKSANTDHIQLDFSLETE
jgi:4'-phosphopantetheinyl transferase